MGKIKKSVLRDLSQTLWGMSIAFKTARGNESIVSVLWEASRKIDFLAESVCSQGYICDKGKDCTINHTY